MPGGLVGPPFGDEPVVQPGQAAPQAPSVPPFPPPPPPPPAPPLPPDLNDLVPTPAGTPIPTAYGLKTDYHDFTGLGWSPIAGGPDDDGPDVAFWRTHRPLTVKKVTFVCQAMGGLPPIPDKDTGDANEVFVDGQVSIGTPTPGPTGEDVTTVTGQYFYVLQRGVRDGDSYGTSSHPLSIYPAVLNTLDPADFKKMLGAARVMSFAGVAIDF